MPGTLKRPLPPATEDQPSGYSSSSASKRARHARDASDRGDSDYSQLPAGNGDLTHAEDSFRPGSIVRVKLTNFVTYTAAEFHLGPSLNMVIGPNGTGKSTLVCAICLGLGWASEHLGRAKEIGLFVKNGCTEAVIEIELAAGLGKDTNPIIRRLIRKIDNKSIFWINNTTSSKTAVLALCKEYSIQIDNLCQFLPQDRVVEFAKMSDVDRLRETQRAAAPPQMVEWHDQLKALRAEERESGTEQQNHRRHLEALEKAQAATREDVEKWQQRQDLLRTSKCLKKARPIIEVGLRKSELEQAKREIALAGQELEKIKEDVEPVRLAQDEAESYRDQIDRVVKLRKQGVLDRKAEADKINVDIDKKQQTVTELAANVSAEVASRRERERDIARTTADIAKLERQHQEQPVAYDPESYSQQLRAIRSQITALGNGLTDKQQARQDLLLRAHDLHSQSKAVSGQRERLDTRNGKQASMLGQLSRDTTKAWNWFRENKNDLSLKGEVYGPPILECSVTEPRYAEAVEHQLREGDYLAITCTHPDDQKLLSNRFLSRAEGCLGLHEVYMRTSTRPLSAYQSPVPHADLGKLGFEGYIIDYLQGPDRVLAMLCDNQRLHRVAYASKSLTDRQNTAASNSPIQKWVSGTATTMITTRKEYNNASSTSVVQLKPAKFFVDQPVNTEEKRQLDDKITSLTRDLAELKEHIDILKGEIGNIESQIAELKNEKDNVEREKAQMAKAVAMWEALPSKIERKQAELDRIAALNAETSNRIRTIKGQSRQASLIIATWTLAYAKAVTGLRTSHESLVEAEIRLIEARSEATALDIENRDILQKLQTKQAEIDILNGNHAQNVREYKRFLKTVQTDIASLSAEEQAIMREYKERNITTLEALEEEVQAVAARLEMMAEGNPGAIKAYEKREEDIAKTREKLEQHTANLEDTKENIIEIRAQWEPRLDALIAKISEAFAHHFREMGCAGEVVVYKDEEDFDKWSAQISVRFREGEPLSVLDSHRQSGGERAVSTIFYLMALQDLAKSPFRVVDEINQGMDPRNERMVHERMVDIACQENTSQYFLITPKLLTGLKFHPKMKVHVINSGEHVPDAKDVVGGWNMKDWARLAMRVRKGVEVA